MSRPLSVKVSYWSVPFPDGDASDLPSVFLTVPYRGRFFMSRLFSLRFPSFESLGARVPRSLFLALLASFPNSILFFKNRFSFFEPGYFPVGAPCSRTSPIHSPCRFKATHTRRSLVYSLILCPFLFLSPCRVQGLLRRSFEQCGTRCDPPPAPLDELLSLLASFSQTDQSLASPRPSPYRESTALIEIPSLDCDEVPDLRWSYLLHRDGTSGALEGSQVLNFRDGLDRAFQQHAYTVSSPKPCGVSSGSTKYGNYPPSLPLRFLNAPLPCISIFETRREDLHPFI